jgi:FG-GAP-like repeat
MSTINKSPIFSIRQTNFLPKICVLAIQAIEETGEIEMKKILIVFSVVLFSSVISGQPWLQNDAIYNTSGVPSLTFSQPRFADLDSDGDMDIILGNTNDAPLYVENIGSSILPAFTVGDDIFAGISALDAEMTVAADLDADGDLDLISGGFNGLSFFENIGNANEPEFQQIGGFFYGLTTSQNPIPDLADVDADNDLDLVVGFSESGAVKIYLNGGTSGSAQFSESNAILLGDVGLYAYPYFCDLDADDDMDIVVGRDSHGFVYYQNTGSAISGIWEEDSSVFSGIGNDTYWNSPGMVDLNGDGTFDLIFGTAAGPLQYFVNNGTATNPSWQENTILFGGVIDVGGASNPVLFDFDDDGDFDLVSGSQLGDIKYYENVGTASAPAWQEDSSYFGSIDHSIYSSITVGDVNGDELPDAIVGDLNGGFYFHQNTGSGFIFDPEMLSSVALGGWSAPRLVDMDADEDLDIVAGNEAGNLFYFENTGSASSPIWLETVSFFNGIDVGSDCVPTVGDLNMNSNLDIVTGNLFGEVQFFGNNEGTWMENPFIMAGISSDQNATPALADLDNDGDLDLTLGDYDGTFSYYENLFYVVEADHDLPQISVIELNNFPNPFNPSTTISFDVTQASSYATIEIYNLKGQKVKTLDCHPELIEGPVSFKSDPRPSTELRMTQAGNRQYSVVWNGTNHHNQPVTSGVYFARLKLGEQTAVRKMLLMK